MLGEVGEGQNRWQFDDELRPEVKENGSLASIEDSSTRLAWEGRRWTPGAASEMHRVARGCLYRSSRSSPELGFGGRCREDELEGIRRGAASLGFLGGGGTRLIDLGGRRRWSQRGRRRGGWQRGASPSWGWRRLCSFRSGTGRLVGLLLDRSYWAGSVTHLSPIFFCYTLFCLFYFLVSIQLFEFKLICRILNLGRNRFRCLVHHVLQ
jgi:hypothetical protein